MNQYSEGSPPHFDPPLTAPRPQKLTPEVPANMAQSLEYLTTSGANRHYNPAPGFVMPTADRGTSPLPPPQGSDWSPWGTPAPQPQPQPQPYNLPASFNNLSFSNGPTPVPYSPPPADPSTTNPSLTAPLPNIKALTAAIQSIQNPSFDPARKIVWCRDTLFLVDRLNQIGNPTSSETPTGPVHIDDPQLLRLTQIAIPTILSIASPQPMPNPLPAHVAEAIYLRATLASSGAYPQQIPLNPRVAFRDFEQAARGGHSAAWFRLGRDYEGFGDDKHAKTCFERGVKAGIESCLYRMGMANLMGQLGLPARPDIALPLLQRAATLATIQTAQPAYVYGLLLLGEFSHVSIPPQYFGAVIPPNSTPVAEARKHLERAAYLNFSPAQYKLGHAYEFAEPPFPFDALLSVQYYSLASQQGETEADMALSKWFLCGAEGAFEKDEALAFTFAEKAARKGLPSAEFAMGYYAEVGVGGPKDIDVARKWYNRAMQNGNTDASDRLSALSQAAPQSLSRQEHDNITESQLVRKRTQAKQRSDATGAGRVPTSNDQGQKIIEVVRKNSLVMPIPPMPHGPPASESRLPPVNEIPQAAPQPRPQQSYPNPPGPGPTVQPQARPTNEYQPGQRPLPGGNKSFAGQQRYALTDPGSRTEPPLTQPQGPPPSQQQYPQQQQMQSTAQRYGPGRGQSAGPPNPGQQGRPQPPHSNSMPPAADNQPPRPKPSGNKPQTFQDMGFQSTKLEEDNCVIM